MALVAVRFAFGAMWPIPRVGARMFGLDPSEQPALPLVGRLFAGRDLALGAALLQAEGADLQRQLDLGIAVDALDLAALTFAALRRQIGARTYLFGGLTAAAALTLGVMARDR